MKHLSIFLPFFFIAIINASSFEECRYKLEVLAKTKTHIKVKLLKSQTLREVCKTHLQKDEIRLSRVSQGRKNAKIGSILTGIRSSHTAMGPNGLVYGSSWSLEVVQ